MIISRNSFPLSTIYKAMLIPQYFSRKTRPGNILASGGPAKRFHRFRDVPSVHLKSTGIYGTIIIPRNSSMARCSPKSRVRKYFRVGRSCDTFSPGRRGLSQFGAGSRTRSRPRRASPVNRGVVRITRCPRNEYVMPVHTHNGIVAMKAACNPGLSVARAVRGVSLAD